jgi:hypothetical protein
LYLFRKDDKGYGDNFSDYEEQTSSKPATKVAGFFYAQNYAMHFVPIC